MNHGQSLSRKCVGCLLVSNANGAWRVAGAFSSGIDRIGSVSECQVKND